MKIAAEFITSAVTARDFPVDGLPKVALVGRSNVGKSSLINALVRQKIARTSSAPGKTRLANIYRVVRGAGAPLYLVDLPGYGFARGLRPGQTRDEPEFAEVARPVFERDIAAVLLLDARHPGLDNDVAAWSWLTGTVTTCALVATKVDKLSRAERLHAMERIEAVFHQPATAVSAETGEGLEDLWKLIDRLANNSSSNRPPPPRRPNRSSPPPSRTAAAATGRPRRRHPKS